MSLTEIKEHIRQMTAQERGDIQTFLENLNESEFNEHWGAIATQRLENLRSGKTKGIPLEEVLSQS